MAGSTGAASSSSGSLAASESPLGGDLPAANRFLFELDGTEIGVFKEVQGLQITVGIHELSLIHI